jgi:hypothetical protein
LGFTASPTRSCSPRSPALGLTAVQTRSTVNRAPAYPGRFLDDGQPVAYFERCFTRDDTEHYHSGIDYVTPQQAHLDLRPKNEAQRRLKQLAQRRRRRVESEMQKPAP